VWCLVEHRGPSQSQSTADTQHRQWKMSFCII